MGISLFQKGDQNLFLDGLVASPGISFLNDPDSGLYRAGSGIIGLVGNGVDIFTAGTASTRFFSVVRLVDGAVGAPGLQFQSDQDCGLFRVGNDNIALVTGGLNRINLSSTGAVTLGSSGSTVTHVINGNLQIAENTIELNSADTATEEVVIRNGVNDGSLAISGGSGSGTGRNIHLFGGTHASTGQVIQFRRNSTVDFEINGSGVVTIGESGGNAQHAINGLSATSASNGTVHALPSTVVEYATITFNGNLRKIPLFPT